MEGICTYSTYHKVRWIAGFDGSEQYNGEMFDMAEVEGGRMAYCQNCGKPICRISTLEKQWKEEPNE